MHRGVRVGSGSRGLQVELFGARELTLAGRLAPSSVSDYVSGVLVGDEVAHLLPRVAGEARVVLCGGDDLCPPLRAGARGRGVPAAASTEDVTVRGPWRTACAAGLVDAG